jgi:hypothetical protein
MRRRVAVKILRTALGHDQSICDRFLNEARATNAIGHPNIIDIVDMGILPEVGAPYLVMEFLEGESLGQRIERSGRIRVGDAVEIAFQTAAAVGAAHAKGIIHRDLKPDNLFLISDQAMPGRERVKVLDFGIAKLTGEIGTGSVRTHTGVVMGTPVYMSPEQCRGINEEVDHRADIYALGVILYEMLCGQPPFVSKGAGELISMHLTRPPEPPRLRNPGIPEHLERTILRALAKDPAQRFATMAELQQALEQGPARTVAGIVAEPALPGAGPRAVDKTPRLTVRLPEVDAPALPRTVRIRGETAGEPGRPTAPGRAGGRAVRPVAGVAALALAGIAAAWILGFRHSTPPEGSTTTRAPGPIAAGVSVDVPVVPPPPTIAVAVTSKPSGAEVRNAASGEVLGLTPFERPLPLSHEVLALVVEKPGYKAIRVEFSGDRGGTRRVDLERLVTRHPSARAKAAPVVVPPVTPSTEHVQRSLPAASAPTISPDDRKM